MNRSPVFRLFLLALVLIAGVLSAHAQTANLLTNPGFEAPFEPLADVPSSSVAQGWTAWYTQTDELTQPEYYPASDTTNGMGSPRIHGGADAQQYFSFFAAHDAGVYQQVSGVTPGDSLTFSVYAYLWSSSGEDPNASDGSGQIALQIGIDPNGGTDATADTVVWSEAQSVVDQYVQHSVTATAASDIVTVFVRSTVSLVAMNNTVYLDDAELVSNGSTGVVPTIAAATEEPTDAAVEAPTEVPTEIIATEVVPTEVVVTAEAPTEAVATVEPTIAATATNTEPPTVAPPTTIPTEVPPTIPPTPSPTLDTAAFPLMFPYTVVRGDTVGQLATRFGSTVEAIIIVNQLNEDARIFETQQLLIPVKELPPPTLVPSATPIVSETPLIAATDVPSDVPSSTPLPPATDVPVLPTEAPTDVPTEVPQVIIVEPSETPVVIQPVATSAPETYIVRFGDTLSSIAVRFGIPTFRLAQENNIVNPNLIMIGQVLRIPPANVPPYVQTQQAMPTLPPPPTLVPTATLVPSATAVPSATLVPPPTEPPPPTPFPPDVTLYQVMAGDNLYRIAIRFNVPLDDLIAANGILNPSRIYVGQVLVIP